jgi:protein SCO1/2
MVVCVLSCSLTAAAGANALDQVLQSLQEPERTMVPNAPVALPDFRLMDQDGRAFGLQELRGRISLVFFGFTNCPNVCPPTIQKLRAVQRTLGADESRFVVALISVDGERDTPEVMKRYLGPFEPGFIGLTGEPKLVRDIAAGVPAVFFKGLPTDPAGGYNVEHTSQAYLINKAGEVKATFYNAPIDDIVAVTRAML